MSEYIPTRLEVSNDDLVTVRDAMRGLNRLVEELQSGQRNQVVLMHRGRMVARIVPVDAFLELPRLPPCEVDDEGRHGI